jgi:histidinol-phosphate/aromatic aminotransferase/cobyric acid decarboxylase-like protein
MLEINNRDWYEIDDQHDLANASLIFAAEKDEYEAFISRFGGYWRFPYVKDYSLLVNPYFPTIDFIQELESEFRTLLTNYPSSRSVIEALAAGYFAISPQEIVVGNGASELTTALGIEWNEETIGLFRPTYEEYSQRFKNVVTAQSSNFIKALTKNEILELAKRVKIICLVNPENPTGQYIPYLDLLDIVKELHERNIKLIIDESFIDFSYEGTKASMINREIIAKFPNLYVIKSISKSYGVPGIRLGVLVSSDTSSLNKIRASLPIWNINSMAEAFLQKINKYRKQYEIALANFRDARVFFETGLQNLGFKVIPSNANYILCSPIESISSGEFARQILHEGYLIKDLNSKPGMQGTNFIRIAIRSLEENKEFLLAAKRVINSQDQSNSS